MKKLSFFNKIVLVLNGIAALALLITCLNVYLTSNFLSPLYILSLFVPALFFINAAFCMYWLFKRKKHFFLSFMVLTIGYFVFDVSYKMNFKEEDDLTNGLSIISYNSRGFNINRNIERDNIGDEIVSFINSENPDIICFQEVNYRYLNDFDKYPFKYLSYQRGVKKSLQAVLSKYPIIEKGLVKFPNSRNNAVYCDIICDNDTLRVYNIHLQSYSIVPSSETLSEEESEKAYHKVVNTFNKQLEQAKIFKEHLSKSPYKAIISGDLNNTQFSNVYRIVKGDFQDSFIEAGKGFGRTYDLKGLPMRIDYILADESFEILEHKNYNIKLSDHYPVKATLRIKN